MGDIANAFAEFAKTEAAAEPEPTEQVVAPEPEASAATPEKPRYSLDDVILDDPRLPDSLRGKPASVLFEERTGHVNKLKEVGFEKNRFKAERDAFEQTLKLIATKRAQAEDEPPPQPTASDQLRRRGTDPSIMYNDAAGYTDSVAEVTEERILPKVRGEIDELRQKLKEREQKDEAAEIRSAFLKARPDNVPQQEWETDYPQFVSAIVLANEWDLKDPQSYRNAADRIEQKIAARAGRLSPPNAPPAAPAPPVGASRTAPVAPKQRTRVSTHEKSAYNRVAEIFNSKNGGTLDADAILSELADDPKYRGTFS